MALKILRKIIKEAGIYAILADETADVSNKEQGFRKTWPTHFGLPYWPIFDQVHVSNFFWGGVAGSEDFARATLPTTPMIFKAKFKIFVTLPS